MKVRFGVIADVHVELIPDGASRVRAFLEKSLEHNVDFCIQLGDFCPPRERNLEHKEEIKSLLRNYSRPFYNVIGNHDTDENSKAEVLAYIGESSSHTSFDLGDVHFIILDTCHYRDGEKYYSYDKGNYRFASKDAEVSVIPPCELEWLEKDLKETKLPSVIFSHHSLTESRTGIRNPKDFRRIAENAPSGVILSVCGHEHVDRLEHKNGIAYYCVNSASYYWAGSKYSHETYGFDVEAIYPDVRKVFPYKEPLFAIIDINDERISVRGVKSELVGASPSELNFCKSGLSDEITPSVKDRRWKIT